MDADDYKIETILKEERRFIVPLYQRKFQWNETRLQPFWEDVSGKAAEVLFDESKFEHYMGALILSPVNHGSQIGRTPVVQIVDGQQRLTTFHIFLAALREVAREYKLNELIEHIEGYLFNKPKSKDEDPLTKFKLTPTESDRDIFHDIIELDYPKIREKHRELYWGERVPKNTPFPAFRAYYLFVCWIKEFALHGPENDAEINLQGIVDDLDQEHDVDCGVVEKRLESMLSSILDRLKLVVITLGENDDAQVIFETLNSKGEPLLAIDLVRNNIFHRAGQENINVKQLYKEFWDPLDHPWWREPAPNARPRRPRIDHFLAHVLSAETGNKISIRELYAEYRAFAVPKGKPRYDHIEKELILLKDFVPLYETLEGRINFDQELYWLGRKLAAWQVTTAYPIAMQIGAAEINEEERRMLTRLIYSFIARRAMCNLTTKNLNNVFQSIASEFIINGVSVETFRSFFEGKDGDSTRFPDNKELKRGVLNTNAYAINPRTRLRDILWELEIASRSRMTEEIQQPDILSVEHVMPLAWTEEWPFDDGTVPTYLEYLLGDSHQALSRNALIHTLGNLTLLTTNLNSSAKNFNFETKKKKFFEHSVLFLNKWFAGKFSWTEMEIRERGEEFSGLATEIWIGLCDIN